MIVAGHCPTNAKTCDPCNKSNLSLDLCNRESRVAASFFALRQGTLWPCTQAVPNGICESFERQDGASFTRACSMIARLNLAVPLKQEVKALAEPARRGEESVRGLCLDCLRKPPGS